MCNGWKNRETWLVDLWFGDHFAAMRDDGEAVTADYIETIVYAYIEENLGAPRHGFIMDMMDLRAIDYDEIAHQYAPGHVDAE
ncbi:MAG: hypothetical protein EHM48_03355 [Planctomycetaceae bacterium]|nr:MAG: hypothetical protein EHM48_03355 [Planctomycetaceae bacterium]